MKIPNPGHRRLMSTSLILAMSAIGCTAIAEPAPAASSALEVVDARQESQIWTTFALSPSLRANDLKVVVRRGKATLSGKVDDDINKELAKQIALGVSGIKEVDNQIVVDADYAPTRPASERDFADVVDDASITAAVKSKLIWSKHADGLATTVETRGGRVSLQGTAASAAARDLAGRLALNTRGVVGVDNRLTVQALPAPTAEKSKSSTAEAGRGISDTWITTKVKSTYLYSSHVDGSGIKVSTSQGVVTLSGQVTGNAERLLAIELAQNLRGVIRVEAKGLKSGPD
ncbi:MAG TPA: BON domain-containing protein [Fluviicoccus sp.]|nr:BON domain-containing protein [Fluviicoccus sp.]